jgi:hypothetical protein
MEDIRKARKNKPIRLPINGQSIGLAKILRY